MSFLTLLSYFKTKTSIQFLAFTVSVVVLECWFAIKFSQNSFENTTYAQLMLIMFLAIVICRLFLLRFQAYVIAHISRDIYKNFVNIFISSPLSNKQELNLISNMTIKLANIGQFIVNPIITAIASFTAIVFYGLTALLLLPKIAVIYGIVVSFGLLIIGKPISKWLKKFSSELEELQNSSGSNATLLFEARKEIQLSKRRNAVINKFTNEEFLLRQKVFLGAFFSQAPKFIIESIIALVALYIYAFVDIVNGGIIASLAFIGYKILPMINSFIASIITIKNYSVPTMEVVSNLKQPYKEHIQYGELTGGKILELRNYLTLNGSVFDCHLVRGKNYLIVGSSGAGKSYILDSIAGLREGDHLLRYDNSISDNVYYISQVPFVFNGTLKENILGIGTNDTELETLGKQLIKKLNLGLVWDENVDPVSISHGQKQRISIIRGICERPQLILADEITASLDPENGRIALQLLLECEATVLAISHDESWRSNFDQVYTI